MRSTTIGEIGANSYAESIPKTQSDSGFTIRKSLRNCFALFHVEQTEDATWVATYLRRALILCVLLLFPAPLYAQSTGTCPSSRTRYTVAPGIGGLSLRSTDDVAFTDLLQDATEERQVLCLP